MIPVSNAADYLRDLPDAQLVTFPHLGHVPQEEAPMELLEPVLRFLAGSPQTQLPTGAVLVPPRGAAGMTSVHEPKGSEQGWPSRRGRRRTIPR